MKHEYDTSLFDDVADELGKILEHVALSRIAKETAMSDELTLKDLDMFDRALEGYARTERELAALRITIQKGEDVPDAYKEPERKYSGRVRGLRAKKASTKVDTSKRSVSDLAGVFDAAFDSLRLEG